MARTPASVPARKMAKHRSKQQRSTRRSAMALLSYNLALAAAQDGGQCISLQDSEACPAFSSASVSTSEALVNALYVKLLLSQCHTYTDAYYSPFLQFVSDTSSFDSELYSYIKTSYVRDRYDFPQSSLLPMLT